MSLSYNILNALVAKLRDISQDTGYDIGITDVQTVPKNPADIIEHGTPLITIIDKSHPEPVVFDGTNYLYIRDLVFTGWVKTNNADDITEQLCKLDSTIKRWTHNVTPADVHTNLLDIQLKDTPMFLSRADMKLGGVHIIVRLIYYTDGDF